MVSIAIVCFIAAALILYRKYKIVWGGQIKTGNICKKRTLLVSSSRKWAWRCDFLIEIDGTVQMVLYEPFYFYRIIQGDSLKVYHNQKHPGTVVLLYDFMPEISAIPMVVLGIWVLFLLF